MTAPHPTLSPEGRGKNVPRRRRAPERSGGAARGTRRGEESILAG